MQRERKFRNKENKQEGNQNQIKSDMVKKKKKSIKMDIIKRREGRSLRIFFVVVGIETRD